MDYILTGEEKYVNTVLKICDYMARRGDIKFIPVNQANIDVLIADDKYVSNPEQEHEDTKTPQIIDEKKPRKRKTK